MNLRKHPHILFFSITFCLLFLSFTFNVFKITDSNYSRFDRADEGYVLGRIIASDVEGLFSYGMLPGNYVFYDYLPDENGNAVETELWKYVDGDKEKMKDLPTNMVQAQMYDDYINNRKIENGYFDAYKTHPCLMATVYSVIHKTLPISNGHKLYLFRIINLLLTTLAFILILCWVKRTFGTGVGIITFALLLFSPWLMRFTHNLWWALWSYYIPFITMLLVLEKKKKLPEKYSDCKVLIYLLLAMFVKFAFTGAEFITATSIMAVCPIIYYAIAERMTLKNGLIFYLKSCLATLSGTLLGFFFLFIKIRIYTGNWQGVVDHMIWSYTKRSSDAAIKYGYTIWDTIKMYLLEDHPFHWEFFPHITFGFGVLVLIICVFSLLVYVLSKSLSTEIRSRNLALIITTAIAILAPLSWIVIFTEHAVTHKVFDYITWYMPYCIYGFIVIGAGLCLLVDKIHTKS